MNITKIVLNVTAHKRKQCEAMDAAAAIVYDQVAKEYYDHVFVLLADQNIEFEINSTTDAENDLTTDSGEEYTLPLFWDYFRKK